MECCRMTSALEHRRAVPTDGEAILNALPNPVLLVAPDGRIVDANIAAESFFEISTQFLRRQSLKELVPFGSPLLALIDQVRASASPVNEYKVDLGTPRIGGDRQVDLHVAPLTERPGHIVVMLQERTIADKMDRQLTHRSAARSVIALAAMLAHEIKNPLSGIRGAAQLLEQAASSEDRMLTRLICDEADRIVTWSTAWKCSATTARWRAVRSTSIPCSTTSNGWRSPASPATSASSKITIRRCRRCWPIRIS